MNLMITKIAQFDKFYRISGMSSVGVHVGAQGRFRVT
jgi:hypothetical protein